VSDNWPAQIASLLEKTPRYELDSVIDGAGGEIFTSISRFLKTNGRVVCYGMSVNFVLISNCLVLSHDAGPLVPR
jgi:NADPH:quinone reductase-like Zn-dependent oxidoreductase